MTMAVSEDDDGSWGSLAELEEKLRKRLEQRHADDIIAISLSAVAGGIELHGQVASEAARSDAIRQLASFHKVPHIIDRLEVTGYFMPASDDEWFLSGERGWVPAATTDEDVLSRNDGPGGVRGPVAPGAISRHPSIATNDLLVIGKKIRIVVDLTVVAQDTEAPLIEIARLTPGWESLDIEVMIVGALLTDINPSRGIVRIMEDGASKAAEFSTTLSNEVRTGDDVKVTALFTYRGRFCGSWETVIGTVSDASQTKTPGTRASLAPVIVTPAAATPGLTVTIMEVDQGDLIWNWTVHSGAPLGPAPSSGRVKIGKNSELYASELLSACPAMSAADFRRRMRAIGEQIWRASPREFQDTYKWLCKSLGADFSIQFIVGEFHVPWEMMRPDTQDDADHLFLVHPVARWPLTVGNWMLQLLPAGAVHSFVPDYPSNATLPAAKEEAKWLINNLAAVTPVPSKAAFLSLLECQSAPDPIGLLHFAGHGRASTGCRDAGIRMEDDWVVIDDVNTSGTKLGRRDRSMVVLNACETAAGETQLGWVEGWAPMLAACGFGAVVAPLWRVQDAAACDVVIGGLSNLMIGTCTLGEAFTKARAGTADKSVAAFAFMTYGDVMARMSKR